MNKYSKLIIITAFLTSVIILIIGAIKSINGMIIGGVISLFGSSVLIMSIMIHNSTTPNKPITNTNTNTNNIITIKNPVSEV